MLNRLFAASALLFVGACASTYSLTPVPDGSQSVTYDRGVAVVMSRKEQGAVRVQPTSTALEGRLSLGVVAYNDAGTGQNLGVENVQLFTSAGTQVRVYTYEHLVKQAKNKAMWQALAVGLAAGANSYAASQPTTSSTYGNVYTPRGTASYSSYTTTYNPANAAIANAINQEQTRRSANQIRAELDATLNNLGDAILRTTTIEPGAAFGGNVIADKPRFSKEEDQIVRVVVTFAGEVHEFQFALAPS